MRLDLLVSLAGPLKLEEYFHQLKLVALHCILELVAFHCEFKVDAFWEVVTVEVHVLLDAAYEPRQQHASHGVVAPFNLRVDLGPQHFRVKIILSRIRSDRFIPH